jgi:hypothetical protein
MEYNMKRTKFLLLLLLIVLTSVTAIAQVPQTMSYQGVLTDATSTTVADGDYLIVFSLYDAQTELIFGRKHKQ